MSSAVLLLGHVMAIRVTTKSHILAQDFYIAVVLAWNAPLLIVQIKAFVRPERRILWLMHYLAWSFFPEQLQ